MAKTAAPDLQPTALTVLHLAWPMVLRAMLLFGTVVIDGYLVSSLGEEALAGMGIAAAAGGIALAMIFAFSSAMQIRLAQAWGTSDKVFVKSTIASGFALSLGMSAVGLMILWTAGPFLIRWLAATDQIYAYAWDYLSVFSFVIVGEAIGQVLTSFFNGSGRTKLPLFGYILSVPVNVLASLSLIHGLFGLPALGVQGAALGTALAVLVQVSFFGFQFLKHSVELRAINGWSQPTFAATFKKHFLFCLPIAATFSSAGIAAQVSALLYARMTINEFAALSLITPWLIVFGAIGMQWTQATGIVVAQLLGKQTEEPVLDAFFRSAWKGAMVAATIVATLLAIVCLLARFIYTELTLDTRMLFLGFLPILVAIPFIRGTNAMCGNTLRASGDTVYVMNLFLCSQWLFRLPLTAVFILYFELSAFWVLFLILAEELVKIFPFHARLFTRNWKKSRTFTG